MINSASGAGTAEKEPFRVVEEKPGCPHCNCGALYMIVFDDKDAEGGECGTSTSYGGPGVSNEEAREAAQEVADDLSFAYTLAATHREQNAESSAHPGVER